MMLPDGFMSDRAERLAIWRLKKDQEAFEALCASFASREAIRAAKRRDTVIACKECGAEFQAIPGAICRPRTYCSIECKRAWHKRHRR